MGDQNGYLVAEIRSGRMQSRCGMKSGGSSGSVDSRFQRLDLTFFRDKSIIGEPARRTNSIFLGSGTGR